MNREPFAPDEWYHCYTRGVDKRTVFESGSDYERFLHALYLCNSDTSIHCSDQASRSREDIFNIERGNPLVSVGAYCLMPNHFHLLLRDASTDGGGISKFMQKVGTGYTMYFNIRRKRVGNLFVKPFRSKHISDDRYLQRVAQYIHFNPIELFEPKWKEGKVSAPSKLEKSLREYPYGSLKDYEFAKSHNSRPERAILNEEDMELLSEKEGSLTEIIEDMRKYYISLA